MPKGPNYQDPVLTTISQKTTNEPGAFIAREIFPEITVPKPTGKYWAYNKDNLRAGGTNIDLRTGRSLTAEATYGKSLKDFGPLQEHAMKDFITKDEYRDTDSPLDVETDVVDNLNEVMMLSEEISLAAMLRNTSIVTQNTTLSGTSQWSDYANSTPFADIKAAVNAVREKSIKSPNTITFSQDVWLALVDHPDLLDRVKWSSFGVLTESDFLRLFAAYGITKILIGKAQYDTSVEGQESNLGSVWGKDVILSYTTTKPGLRTANGGYTLRLREGKYVDKWDENDPKGTWVRNNDFYDQMLFASEMFYLIKNAIA